MTWDLKNYLLLWSVSAIAIELREARSVAVHLFHLCSLNQLRYFCGLFQTKKNYYNNFIKPMKLVRELRLFVLQDVFVTNRMKHSVIESISKEKVCVLSLLLSSPHSMLQTFFPLLNVSCFL